MDYVDYVNGISFRLLQPSKPRPKGLRGLNMLLRKAGIHLESLMTRLPEEPWRMRRRLRPVLSLPRMSTFAVAAMINRAVGQMPVEHAFVNVGVWHGFTFFSGLLAGGGKRCIGVDNFSHKNSPKQQFLEQFDRFAGPKHEFHERDFREYFADVHEGPIGFYLFDGPHLYKDQLDGLSLAEPFFAENCLVMVDDTNWDQVRRANLDFMAGSPNSYRMLLDVETPGSGHPTFWNGLMIFQLAGTNRCAKSRSRTAA